jgi:flavin reductase (DIM6/NTAB) family NADH-FMN oxidoreductase RutF
MDGRVGPVRTFDPGELPGGGAYFLLNSLVVPRPIAWVGTVSASGVRNLAPHSFFTVACASPPMVQFTSIGAKDTVRNVVDTGCFTVGIVDAAHAEVMNVTAANAPPGVDEFDLAGVAGVPGDAVAAPRVVEAPASLECELEQLLPLGGGGPESPASYVVIGRVVLAHVAERLYASDPNRVDPGALDAIARMGASDYATTRDRFELRRPTHAGLVAGEPVPRTSPPLAPRP